MSAPQPVVDVAELRALNHALRSQLMTIITFGDLLEDESLGRLGDAQRNAVDSVLRAATKISNLSESLSVELRKLGGQSPSGT